MPNRIIKESICTSDNIDQLTPFQEVVFYRLMVNCDDFGRFDARAKLLASRLFPLRDIESKDMDDALMALERADLIVTYVVNGRPYLQMNTWEKHQQRRSDKSKYPAPDDACEQMISNDIKCNQMISNDGKFPRDRERNRDTLIVNRESLSSSEDGMIADDEARKIQSEQNRVMDAATDAGFKIGNTVMANLIRLYAEYGLDRMLAGIDSCAKHGAPNLAYLEACLKGEPRKKKASVNAQDFPQRDYSDADAQLMDDLRRDMEEFKGVAG